MTDVAIPFMLYVYHGVLCCAARGIGMLKVHLQIVVYCKCLKTCLALVRYIREYLWIAGLIAATSYHRYP